jgi:hypothetical protein
MRYRHHKTGVVVDVRDGKVLGGAWVPAGMESAGTAPAGENDAPPKAGAGSSRKAWAEHAATLGVDVDEHMTRDDIIDAVEGK